MKLALLGVLREVGGLSVSMFLCFRCSFLEIRVQGVLLVTGCIETQLHGLLRKVEDCGG